MQSRNVIAGDESGSSNTFTSRNCREALSAFLNELSEKREKQDALGEAWVLVQLGDIYSETRRYQLAFDHYEKAMPLFRQLKNDARRAILDNLVDLSLRFNKYSRAIECLNELLSLTRDHTEKWVREGEGRLLGRIASVHFASGDSANGVAYLYRQLDFEVQRKDQWGISTAFTKLGKAYEAKNERTKAGEYYRKALDIKLKISPEELSSFEDEITELRDAIARMQN